MSEHGCPFCAPEAGRIFYAGALTLGLWDGFPVSPGHALLVPKRHVASWFDASLEERAELLQALDVARSRVLEQHAPQGFNIGINVGEAAGQTIFHLHVHLIPRYEGDLPDPRGGVRHVLPHRARYWAEPEHGAEILRDRADPMSAGVISASVSEGALIGGGEDPLLPHLLRHLDQAQHVDIAVAFVVPGGVALLEAHLREVLERGGKLRFLTGDYFDVTEPSALLKLLDLREEFPEQVELRVFECGSRIGFHPKAYVLRASQEKSIAFVGSANLTRSALTRGGIEWTYRVVPASERTGFDDVVSGFEALFAHGATRPLTADWVRDYAARRAPTRPVGTLIEVPEDPPEPPPEPHEVQREALAALRATRDAGNQAGLVVLATGLGKTWLSAFDSAQGDFRRVLFVAHREEILGQAMRTFRRIRPEASLGLYNGREKAPDAEVLFASVQTLGRAHHLERFAPDEFDYIVVDEFHHAAARTYRRLLDHFTPRFLLGLTATPERTDGGDLLGLCQENLVYRCDLTDGIRRGLLSPFHYFGVPDEVDYRNIPWRNARFDPDALTAAVATQARAQNALEQFRSRAGERTLAFCCSTRHADFMRDFFAEAGIRAAAVHSEASTDPRATSLERLGQGDLDIVFAVDMFNEGVDLPTVDTILMLRPTESRILWLQQFGRGLRKAEGKDHVTVIDYIGNHRAFLLKPQTLLNLGMGDAVLRETLDRAAAGELDLPPGCEVTYELEAVEILRSLLRSPKDDEALRFFYEDFRERNGARPTASEAFHEGYNPRAARRGYGSWLEMVRALGDLSPEAESLLDAPRVGGFLKALETTPMTRSYKMLVLRALLTRGQLPGALPLADLAEAVRRQSDRSAELRRDLGPAATNPEALAQHLVRNPIEAWIHGKGTGGATYFAFEADTFLTTFDVPGPAREAFQELATELVDWRLAEYLTRPGSDPESGSEFLCNVSHANGRPMVFLPDRRQHPDLPEGWTSLEIEGEPFEGNFVKVALNVVREPGTEANQLPAILRRWFGERAGAPGTRHQVRLDNPGTGWRLHPAGEHPKLPGAELWKSYQRSKIPPLYGLEFSTSRWNQGFVFQDNHIFLLVTLDKSGKPAEHRYGDRFLEPDLFEWFSQNRHRRDSPVGKTIRHHVEQDIPAHLFVRQRSKIQGTLAPFIYCGDVHFEDWDGDQPITVRWRLGARLPKGLWEAFDRS